MEFKSTLEKESEKQEKHLKEARAKGYSDKGVDDVFELVSHSGRAVDVMIARTKSIAKTIQPSISGRDLQIAGNMMCAMASQLVLMLKDEGLISINK